MNYKPTIVNINSLSSSKRPNYHYVWETQTLLTLECWLGLLSNPFNFKDGLELIISLLKPISASPFLLLHFPSSFPGSMRNASDRSRSSSTYPCRLRLLSAFFPHMVIMSYHRFIFVNYVFISHPWSKTISLFVDLSALSST